MIRALVLHYSFNGCGGGERVSLHTIKALMEAGHHVEVGTIEKTDWKKVFQIVGIKLPRIPKEHSIMPVSYTHLTLPTN